MGVIRKKAIEELKLANPALDPIEQIVAARKYDCMELVETPMGVLVGRKEPLSFEEMVKLAPEDLHKWITERDKPRGGYCTYTASYRTGYCYQCCLNH